jgi:hypothetical protein
MLSVHDNPCHDWLFDSRTSIHVIGNQKALGVNKNIGSKIIIKIVGGRPTLLLAKDMFCLILMN